MSQMHQSATGSTCPNPACEEPVESGDRFCGGCGYDLSALSAAEADRPTIPVNGGAGAAPTTPARGAPDPVARPHPATDPDAPRNAPPDPGAQQDASSDPGAQGHWAPEHGAQNPAPSSPGAQRHGTPGPGRSRPGEPDSATVGIPAAPAAAHGPDGTPAASGQWPAAAGAGSPGPTTPAHLPTDLPGNDSHGTQLPVQDQPGAPGRSAAPGTPLAAPAQPPLEAEQLPPPPVTSAPHLPEFPTPPESPSLPDQSPRPPATLAPVYSDAPATTLQPAAAPAPADDTDYQLAAPSPPADRAPGDESPSDVPSPVAAAADPRTVAPGALPAPAADGKLCVFCATGRVDQDGYCEHCGKAQPRERDHMEQELDAVAAVSDRGLRHHRNEDAFAVSSIALQDGAPAVLAVVCDGVSSASRPDDASMAASRAATETLLAALPRGTHPQQAMHDAILAAAEAVNALAREPAATPESGPNQNAPACTLVGAIVAKDLLIVGWVGDSRVYWVPVDRAAPAARLTEDDSWAAQMVASGLMNEAEAYADERAHAITGWLGADAYELEPHTASFKPDRPGVAVVCTDGLWNYAEGAGDMASVLPVDAAQRPLHSAQVLVGHALDEGGHDNVTVAVLPFPAPSPGAGSA